MSSRWRVGPGPEPVPGWRPTCDSGWRTTVTNGQPRSHHGHGHVPVFPASDCSGHLAAQCQAQFRLSGTCAFKTRREQESGSCTAWICIELREKPFAWCSKLRTRTANISSLAVRFGGGSESDRCGLWGVCRPHDHLSALWIDISHWSSNRCGLVVLLSPNDRTDS